MAETIISPGVFQRENDISFIQPAPPAVGAAIIGPTVKGPVEIPTLVTSYNDYSRKFGVTFESGSTSQEYLTSIAAKSYFDQGGESILVSRVVPTAAGWASAQNTHISSSNKLSVQPFEIKTIGEGIIYNNSTGTLDAGVQNSDNSLKSGSADNLRWEISNVDSAQGTFTLSVRRGDDNLNSKIILETFNNLSLDPNSPNYISAKIGDQYKALSSGDIITTGDYINKSNYIYVSAVNLKTFNYLGNDGKTIGTDSASETYSNSLPVAASGSFHSGTGNNVQATNNYFGDISTNTQGLAASDYTNIITLLGNKDEFLFNVISAPGLIDASHGTTVDSLVSLVETRGDCIAVVDLVGYAETTVSNVTTQAQGHNSSYAASYWPWLQVQSATGRNVWVPASTVIPGVYAFTDNSSAPWFAPAGLVRGGLVGVIQAKKKLTRSDRDSLYNGKVNPIATFPGTGISVFGQKTLQTKSSALDRVNVRRLLIELKKFLGDQAKNLVFEQNTIATRNRFLSAVNPYLESVVQQQGLFSYRVVMDDSNNTADVVDRNQLVGQIFIQPARTAEFIVLDFVVEPTGATFDA
jgi:phage tail sheath protein FI